jgi:hypothetical protein
MGKMYSIVAPHATMITAVNVLQGIYPVAAPNAAGSLIKIYRVEIGQDENATSAMIRGALSWRTGGNLTVATVTPSPLCSGGPAATIAGVAGTLAAGKCGITGSADATPTYVDFHEFAFNALNGYLWIPTPEERPVVAGAMAFVVRFLADPATLLGWTSTVVFEEVC